MNTLKQEIINNKFINSLRLEFVINETEYNKLVKSLKELAIIWNNEKVIDKELMSYIYIIPTIIRGQIRNEYTKDQQTRLEDMEIEIDNLILELLKS